MRCGTKIILKIKAPNQQEIQKKIKRNRTNTKMLTSKWEKMSGGTQNSKRRRTKQKTKRNRREEQQKKSETTQNKQKHAGTSPDSKRVVVKRKESHLSEMYGAR